MKIEVGSTKEVPQQLDELIYLPRRILPSNRSVRMMKAKEVISRQVEAPGQLAQAPLFFTVAHSHDGRNNASA